jgi:pectin methylesterase-like acyl-CoA thioesterase
VVKVAPNGSVVLNRTFGGSDVDFGVALTETDDGGLAVVGRTDSYGPIDVWLVTFAPNGTVVMNRTFGGSEFDLAESLVETRDGGLAFAGYTRSYGGGEENNAWVVKVAPNGSVVLNRTFGGSGYDNAFSLVETEEEGLVFAGGTESYGSESFDAWVLEVAPNGTVVLNRTFGGSEFDSAESLVETGDGGVAFGGETESYGAGSVDAWAVKIASDGSVVMNRTFGGRGGDVAVSLVETGRDRLAFAGTTDSYGAGSLDAWVITVSETGDSNDPTTCIDRAVAGAGGMISLPEIQTAINWWAEDTDVPNTGGQTISLPEIQDLINAWAEDQSVGCTS